MVWASPFVIVPATLTLLVLGWVRARCCFGSKAGLRRDSLSSHASSMANVSMSDGQGHSGTEVCVCVNLCWC
jgi:hypothetical protein